MASILIAALASGLFVLAVVPAHASRLRPREPPADGLVQPVRPPRLLGAVGIGAAVWFVLASLGPLAVVFGAGGSVLSYVMLGRLRTAAQTRRQAVLAGELPQVCDLLVACLEAGLPVRVAAEVVAGSLDGPMAERLGEFTAKTRLGLAEERAWEELAAEPALVGLGRELARGAGSGVALVARLRALGLDARRDAFAAAEARAKKVGVQSVLPLLLCFLPAFVLLGVLPIVGGLVLRFFAP